MSLNEIDGMSNADLMHYAREQRKYIYDHYEKYKRHAPEISLTCYIQKIYIPLKLANKFHDEFMAKHRLARDYLATVSPNENM